LNVYSFQTAPLLDYYKNKGLLFEVDGDQEVSKVFEDIKKYLD
jgi:adenylate kinase